MPSHLWICGWDEMCSSLGLYDVQDLDKPVKLDIICRHDIIDTEINGRTTTANRYWDKEADCIYLVSKKGTVMFHNITIRPLIE